MNNLCWVDLDLFGVFGLVLEFLRIASNSFFLLILINSSHFSILLVCVLGSILSLGFILSLRCICLQFFPFERERERVGCFVHTKVIMKAHFQLFVHGNCTQWILEKSFLECSKRKFQMNLHSQESWSLQNKHLSPQCCMKKKDAGVMKRSIMGDHGRMMMINKSKASDPDTSHSSIFINLNNGGSSSSSSSTNIDTPELALSSSVFIESDGDGDDDYCSFRGLVLDLSYRYVFDQ